jgi:hypothetical protein
MVGVVLFLLNAGEGYLPTLYAALRRGKWSNNS